MATTKEYIQLIDRLTELTQSTELEWERRAYPGKLVSTESQIDAVYEVEYKNRNLRLYEKSYKNYTDEYEYQWTEGVVLEFVDGDGDHVWQFPNLRSIWDLLKAVKYKEAGVDSFINDVLGDL